MKKAVRKLREGIEGLLRKRKTVDCGWLADDVHDDDEEDASEQRRRHRRRKRVRVVVW